MPNVRPWAFAGICPVSSHGESGLTARLVPFTVDGLILAASMLMLDASRRNHLRYRWRASATIDRN